ncbi:MAG: hypothetical protein R3190_17175, partial [Thermoanaerobaculia bacterium]|nr:hypothetical protein [Thermoanaerobaculia bacterium]
MRTPWSEREWRRVAVYGLGRSGLAAARLLFERGVDVVGVDRRATIDVGEPSPFAALVLGQDDPALPERTDAVVVSPGVPRERRL